MTLAQLVASAKSPKASKASPGERTFTTKDGRVVTFTPKRKAPYTGPLSPYAEYVRDHIHGFHDQGMSWPEAMKAVAKQYRKR